MAEWITAIAALVAAFATVGYFIATIYISEKRRSPLTPPRNPQPRQRNQPKLPTTASLYASAIRSATRARQLSSRNYS